MSLALFHTRSLCTSQRWELLGRCLSSVAASRNVASLDDVRGVLRLSGTDLIHFLQGLVTNNVLPLEAPNAPPVYACILNAQGRYLHDLFFFRTADAQPTLLVDTDAAGTQDLLRLLKRYRLRQKIDMDDVTSSHSVGVQWHEGGDSAAHSSGAAGGQPGWEVDPRLAALGCRAVLPREPDHGAADSVVPREAYKLWRLQQGVAEGDAEIPPGEAIALEYNIDGLNGISFSKGCYVGQELMARTHFKGVVRKRVMPFTLAGGSVEAADAEAEVFADAECSGKSVGKVRVMHGHHGLALMRLSAALPAAQEGRPLFVRAGGELHVRRPEWWPPHWGLEG